MTVTTIQIDFFKKKISASDCLFGPIWWLFSLTFLYVFFSFFFTSDGRHSSDIADFFIFLFNSFLILAVLWLPLQLKYGLFIFYFRLATIKKPPLLYVFFFFLFPSSGGRQTTAIAILFFFSSFKLLLIVALMWSSLLKCFLNRYLKLYLWQSFDYHCCFEIQSFFHFQLMEVCGQPLCFKIFF